MGTIYVSIAEPGNTRAHNSLVNSLNDNQYLRDNATMRLPDSTPDGMGPGLDLIQFVVGSGFDLATLALALAEWCATARDVAAPLVVQTGGRSTELSLEDLADREDRNGVVHRALAGAPDPRRSSCVLVGVSDYASLAPLPGVDRNLVRLRDVLVDPAVWGVPPDRVQTIEYPQSADVVTDAIAAAGRDGVDTVVVYVAGHGLYDQQYGLLIALPEATGRDRSETVPWRELADAIRDTGARRQVVVLDCCYGGRALPDANGRAGTAQDPPDLVEAAQVEGVYLMVAAEHGEALALGGDGCTAFTGRLVDVLQGGIAPGPPDREYLSLNAVHQEVREALRKDGLPQPARHDPHEIGRLPHFRNNAARPRDPLGWLRPRRASGPGPEHGRRVNPRPARGLRRSRRGVVVAVGLIAVVVLAVVGLLFWAPWNPGTPVSGLSLTKYCSALGPEGAEGFDVAATDCVHQINLNEACDFQYRMTGLEATFRTADPNSAVCVDPDTGTRYDEGISDMTGYCSTLTTVADVTATATSPGYEKTWICKVPINLDLACDTQNNQNDLVAGKDDDGGLQCYRG